jgi:hypothetical protein
MNAPTKNDVPVTVTLTNIDYGATIAVPTRNVHEYAGLKTEQLAVLTGLISDQTGGFALELDNNDMWALATLADELAHLNKGLASAIAGGADTSEGQLVMTKNDDSKIDVANASDSDPTGLRMDPARSARFTSITSRMARAIYSLEAASELMEGLDFNEGEVNPAATVQAFCKLLSEDIDRMYQMLGNADKPESDASKGGA